MAGLNARSESFIGMLLEVSGRARVADLQGMSADDAAMLLSAYADAHPERQLAFDGTVLSAAAPPQVTAAPQSAARQAPMPQAAPAPPSAVPYAEEPAPLAPSEYPSSPGMPDMTSGGMTTGAFPQPAQPAPTGAEELPSWFYEEGAAAAAPPAEAAPEAPDHESVFGPAPAPAPAVESQGYGVPQQPSPGGFYGVPDAAAPEYVPVTESLAGEDTFVEPQTPSTMRSGAEEYVPYQPQGSTAGEKMQWWWYLIAFFFWPIGGIAGFFIVRPHDPKGARNLLIFTAAYFLVSLLLAVAMIVLLLPLAAQSAPVPSP